MAVAHSSIPLPASSCLHKKQQSLPFLLHLLFLCLSSSPAALASVTMNSTEEAILLSILPRLGKFWHVETWVKGALCEDPLVGSDVSKTVMWVGVTCMTGTGNVIRLDLHGTVVAQGPIPAELAGLSFLQTLDLSFNSFTGNIPLGFSALTNLQFLSLNNNKLSGAIPAAPLSTLVKLEYLGLSGNGFTGDLPSFISAFPLLNTLALGDNRLSGAFPASWSSLSLHNLMLKNNSLNGVNLGVLGSIITLENVDLSQNAISGSFPASFVALTSLQLLDLSRNLFRGSIADIFGGMNVLWNVNLASNFFGGLLPASLLSCPRLQILDISSNTFTGNLPTFTSLELSSFRAAGNFFYGLPVISVGGTPTCALTMVYGGTVANNCLVSGLSTGCNEQTQKSPGDCSAFCGTSSTVSTKTQCSGGVQVCVLDATNTPVCV